MYTDFFEEIGDVEIVYLDTHLELMKAVSSGEVDAMLGPTSTPYLVQKHEMSDLVMAAIVDLGCRRSHRGQSGTPLSCTAF